MREFWLWVIIVTLLIFLIFICVLGILHIEKRLNKADQLIQKAQKLTETKGKEDASNRSGDRSEPDQ